MTNLSKDYPEIEALAPHRRQTWRNVLTLGAVALACMVIAGVVGGVGGAIAWFVGTALVRAWL